MKRLKHSLFLSSYFDTKTEGDFTWSARHCPQESLPEPWRSNDISQYLE